MVSLVALPACKTVETVAKEAKPPVDKIPVILDTDIGTDIDDTWALLHLLNSPELEVKLVVTATGNTTHRAELTAKFLEVAERTDIPIGIGIQGEGGVDNIKTWVEDYSLEDFPGTLYQDGVQALIDHIHASPTPVTLLVIGPATNIKEALERDPSIAPKCRFIGMHGSINIGYEGKRTPANEYNVRADVPAFQAVLNADWLKIEITPLDTCGEIVLDGSRYKRLYNSDTPTLISLFENYKIFTQLVSWTKIDFFKTRSTVLFDCVAVYMAYSKEGLNYESIPLSVTKDGATIRDPEGRPVDVALSWNDKKSFLNHLAHRLDSEKQ